MSFKYLALQLYSILPRRLQRFANRTLAVTYNVAAKVYLTNPDGQFLSLKLTYRTGWDLPGGFIDKGESPQQAAVRELREETGLEFDGLTQAGVIVEPLYRTIQILFVGQLDHTPELTPDGVEISELRWARPGELTMSRAAADTLLVLLEKKVPYYVSMHKGDL
jgi:ADP-ribose pyrophosphatase YjhB (NUDIX family)